MARDEIAVIGMAGRFPGAATLAEYWTNIRNGVESIRQLSDEQLLAAGVSVADMAHPDYVKAAPILDGVDAFDATFFGLSPRDASVMDPAHRLFLEVAWEAVEHAGRTALPDEGAVGVFAGSGASYYLMDHVRRNADLMRSMGEFLARHLNNDMNFLATRVSYEMDLRGPSVNIQTACSSALVSVHMACESIRRGECVMALAGGSTVILPDGHGYLYQDGEIMSPDGHCRPFDARSAGTVFGSGSGCVVLKRLSVALDDGDTIYAVIKGSAINNDGALRAGFLAPGVEGQAAAVARALDVADVPADSITYIEAHGTGTSVGDPIEVAGLNQAFRERTEKRRYCALGSVKSNIGHLGEAAGVAALIKVILALQHRELPPSLGYERPNPQIDFDDSPFFVNDRLRPWTSSGPRRCGVTALGAGGTNCHVILEEAPAALRGEGAREVQLLLLSARSATALEQGCENLAQAIEDCGTIDLADAAYTLAVGRRAMPYRAAFVARHREQAVERLRDRDAQLASLGHVEERAAPVVFMFAGGGAQYAQMGRELYECEAVYRDAADECLAIANAHLGRDLGALMFAGEPSSLDDARALERPTLSLPSLFTTEYALAKLYESWGVEAAAYLGHSMGEYVAACLAGVISLSSALELVMLRGRLFESVPRGRMVSVSLSESAVRELMPHGLDVAAVNAPQLCTVSGPEELMSSFERLLSEREVDHSRVRIDVAAHSAMLDPVLETFRTFCRTVSFHAPRRPFLSNLTGRWITAGEAMDPNYWVSHLRSTVRFADCLETLRARGEHVMLEVGPGRTLTSLARAQTVPSRHTLTSMRRPDESASDLEFALLTIGRLWQAGVHIEWSAFYEGQLRNRVALPTYAWDHRRHWIAAPVADASRVPSAITEDSSRRADVADWFSRPVWHQTLPAPVLSVRTETVLLFVDATGFGEHVAALLEAAGRHVIRVIAGEGWRRSGQQFTVRAAAVEDYERLLQSLAADGRLPDRIVHAWAVTDDPERASIRGMMELGFHSLLAFAQALANVTPDAAFTLDVITSSLQCVGGESHLEPAKALVLGPARVMQQESATITSRSIDVVLQSSAPQRHALAALVAAEVAAESSETIIAYRGSERFTQSIQPVRLDPIVSRVKDGGVYIITGALGGIGYTVAEYLARSHRARLVLVGRGASRARAGVRIAALEAAGAEVEVVQADVTDVEQMKGAVARAVQRFGKVNGVFHAAGALGDSLMPLKTREDAERVMAPKVLGTIALDAALGARALDLFVLFSSISSVAGLAGQADYTSANAFLDAYAQERRSRDGSFTVAVNWSAWRDVGMAANLASGAGAGGGVDEFVHPLLGQRIWSSAEAELFSSHVSVAQQWVVGEHRLRGGLTLMPGTGYVEMARAALAARAESRPLEIRELVFLSPFVVTDHESRELRTHLARGGADGRALVIAGRVAKADGTAAWEEHVTATVGYVDVPAPAAMDIAAIVSRCPRVEDRPTGSDESVHMQFGPRWKNIASIRFGHREALVTLVLPEAYLDDLASHPLHPALMDMATGSAWKLIDGFDARADFYVPLSYARLRMHAPLAARIHSHVRLVPSEFDAREFAVFDVTIADADGKVLVEIDEFVMARVTDTSRLQSVAPSSATRRLHASFDPPPFATHPPPLVEWLDEAIRPAEGVAALERILSGPALSQVYATPKSVGDMVAQMRRQRPESTVSRTEATPPHLVVMTGVERELATHEVVRECAVVERMNTAGAPTLVAYVAFEAGLQATGSDLRRYLKARIPDQVVRHFVDVAQLPRTSAGEVDLAALPDPFASADRFVAPRSETERTIASIWGDVLGLSRVGLHDNFFDIGGHSLLAVRAVVRLQRATGVRLNQAMMVMQTLEQSAAEVDRQAAARSEATSRARVATVSARESGDAVPESHGAARSLLGSLRHALTGKQK